MPVPVPPVFTEMAARVRNWGRWGPDDEVGTLNLIDDAARRRGAAAVVSGKAFGLGLPLSEAEGIQLGFVEGRVNPTLTMVQVNQPVHADQPEWVCFITPYGAAGTVAADEIPTAYGFLFVLFIGQPDCHAVIMLLEGAQRPPIARPNRWKPTDTGLQQSLQLRLAKCVAARKSERPPARLDAQKTAAARS